VSIIALVVVLVTTGCGGDGGGGETTPSFDGSTLAGTKWESSGDGPSPFDDSLKMTVKTTVNFTSDTEGTMEVKITKFTGNWVDEMKEKMNGIIEMNNGAFTSTYDAAEKKGTLTPKGETTPQNFTVNVGSKTLTIEDDDDGPTVLNLK
jgi:hypothetical protein